jgi:hypothetical protein
LGRKQDYVSIIQYGKKKAFEIAKAIRHETSMMIKAQFPPLKQKVRLGLKLNAKTNEESPMVGANLCKVRHPQTGKVYESYHVQYWYEDGTPERRCYTVLMYGKEGARKLAIRDRKEAVKNRKVFVKKKAEEEYGKILTEHFKQ